VILDPLSAEKAFRNQLNVNGEQFDSKVNIVRIPLKSAGDSGANRPLIPKQSGRGRSEATLEFFH